jgi:dUTP pyrophosphatase
MSNSIGLIDAGYRGELIAVVDNISDDNYLIKEGTRLFQIVNPSLTSFSRIEIMDNLTETERGTGGFGSTGS